MPKLLTPIHPGEIIREDVLTPLGLSVNQLAKLLSVDAARLNEIVRGRRGVTADTALRLARYLGSSAEFWMRLQGRLRTANGKAGEAERDRERRTTEKDGSLTLPGGRGGIVNHPPFFLVQALVSGYAEAAGVEPP